MSNVKSTTYYVFDYSINQPLIIDGRKVESHHKGPLLNWLQKSLLMLSYDNEGDLSGRGLEGHKLGILAERAD